VAKGVGRGEGRAIGRFVSWLQAKIHPPKEAGLDDRHG
jgi:hypothetical protein